MNNKVLIPQALLALSLSAGMLVGCSKDEDRIEVSASPMATPTVSATSVTPDADNLSAVVLTLSWEQVKFSSDLVIPEYEIEVSAQGQSPIILSSPAGRLSYDFTGAELNELLLDRFRGTVGVATDLSFRVRSYPHRLSSSVAPSGSSLTVSQPISIRFTAVDVKQDSPLYYYVGSGLGASVWDINHTGYPFFKDATDAKTYTYTGQFTAGAEFKVVQDIRVGDWSVTYGDNAGRFSTENSGNIHVPAAGYYTITINPTEGTFSIAPKADATAAPTYNQIGLVGTAIATDVTAEVLLEPTAYDPHIWTKMGVQLMAGSLRLRANQSDDKVWGGDKSAFPAAVSTSTDNIEVSAKRAGTYDVFFNDLTGQFLFRSVAQ